MGLSEVQFCLQSCTIYTTSDFLAVGNFAAFIVHWRFLLFKIPVNIRKYKALVLLTAWCKSFLCDYFDWKPLLRSVDALYFYRLKGMSASLIFFYGIFP